MITADNKKPLTFLDHHLKTGNALVGAKLENLGVLPEDWINGNDGKFQSTLSYSAFKKEYIPHVLRLLKEMDFSSEKIEDIDRKKDKIAEWEKLKKNLEIVADTSISTFFGYQLVDKSYQTLLNKAVELKEIQLDPQVEKISIEIDSFTGGWSFLMFFSVQTKKKVVAVLM